ncbi:MAG: helix-turn-helix domain-containing protein [Gemmatimonadetes bacterium]|jgi:transcriptional regulator GlxA family with amidase domain|nr:helix-turn-helix domain-containing protein [Gemmatimonadota bacterium]MBP9106770.1 helix-turn-helix domain-containing protein [Gemmatimonadaceae bacterium]MBK6457610.1 helix-turn-helix domain-containing protein [Gemmatimonadota bacterium]MBK6842850.1 helix-turn-helix domain-containing protein [Gemmatimonadota bacterium]MBK7831296.1 helix-turn-helix domain-containing protein [Gemmatimonadota bacterium]
MTFSPHRVAVLVLPSVVPFDLAVPSQIFGYPRDDLGLDRYVMTLCTAEPGEVQTSIGFSIVVPRGLAALRGAQTIVVPGIDDLERPIAPQVLRALQRAHARGVRLVSICTGAFVLAEAGLLDGRRATTHWIDVPEFAHRYPAVTCDPDVLYVDEGNILTSAGIASGIDLCLHIVRSDYGAAVANAVARRMVVAPHRSGGQAQFVRRALPDQATRPLDATRAWMQARLTEPLTLPQMASHATMSVRSFARHFLAETGTTPLQWLLRQRIAAAQLLLEETDLGMDRIASDCGFGSAVSLRVHFRREVRVSPLAYRRAFRAARTL